MTKPAMHGVIRASRALRFVTAKDDQFAETGSRSTWTRPAASLAWRRRSSVILIEQNFGPHIEQKAAVLKASWGRVSSCIRRAVSGSSERLNWASQSNL